MFDNDVIKINAPLHGGNLTAAIAEFGPHEDGWIDLSTGINPVCYPVTEISENAFRMLPTPGDTDALLTAASSYYAVSPNSSILAAPGTQSILETLPMLYPSQTVSILTPTYSEHRHTWEKSGNPILETTSLNDLEKGDIAVLVNPNNPDGKNYDPRDILDLADKVELLIVDEAFADSIPEISLIPRLNRDNIIVLRSLGKFFGLAGLRLGFAVGPADITDALADRLGPWAVSGPAIEVGTRALSDNIWCKSMQQNLKTQSARLKELLTSRSIKIAGSTDLFILIEIENATQAFQSFGQSGILIRKFEDNAKWLRLGLPGIESEWQRVTAVLDDINNMGE